MVDTATEQLIVNVMGFVMRWIWEGVILEQIELYREERKELVMGISRMASIVWMTLSVRKTFISVDKKRFQTCVTGIPRICDRCT